LSDSLFAKQPPKQAAFQASSTDISLPERYMVWNNIGVITQFNKDDDESIDCEFHNATYHHTIHVKNHMAHTMADISKEMVVMANSGDNLGDDDDQSSKKKHGTLVCILINSWDTNNKEWTITMPKKEFIRGVCATNHIIGCITNMKLVRVFTKTGLQREIFGIGGDPLCIKGYDHKLFICYHQSLSCIGYILIDLANKNDQFESGLLTLTENSKLEWIGFSDEGNPYYYDSNGYLFGLFNFNNNTSKKMCIPIMNMRTGLHHKSDNYWIVGISERTQMVKSILCKGSKYPQVLPRPNLQLIPIQIPLCEIDAEKTKLEQDVIKYQLIGNNIKTFKIGSGDLDLDSDDIDELNENFEIKTREYLMKLFMMSCRTNKEQRSYETAQLMDTVTLQLAIKYATKTRMFNLAQNLNMLAEKKSIEEYEKVKEKEKENNNEMDLFQPDYSTLNTFNKNNNENRQQEQEEVSIIDNQSVNNDEIKLLKSTTTTQNDSMSLSLDTSVKSCLTPTAIPLTTTRINPFKVGNNSSKPTTPLNDSSIINKIEDTLNRQNSANKDKETWKPASTNRSKLTKSKLSTTPTINSNLNSFLKK
jgi:chromosome transmission fidelity protein 4